jgi:hypothetical protein
LQFPKVDPFEIEDKVTIHLDNRTGVELFTIELNVYRCSYKGIISEKSPDGVKVLAEEFVLRFGNQDLLRYSNSSYGFPVDIRNEAKLQDTELNEDILPDAKENENKLGVWITRAVERPHTTVMAFLSSKNDDIFVISHEDTFKSSLIHKDKRCMFAIDHRASYLFERKYDWNYTIIKAEAEIIGKGNSFFDKIQALFVEKNPWEAPFFTDEKVELFHLKPIEVMYPEKYYDKD